MVQCEIMDLIKWFRSSSMEEDIYSRTIHGTGDSVQLTCIISPLSTFLLCDILVLRLRAFLMQTLFTLNFRILYNKNYHGNR